MVQHSDNRGVCAQQNLEELAVLESLDNGKPYDIAKSVDVPMVHPHNIIVPYASRNLSLAYFAQLGEDVSVHEGRAVAYKGFRKCEWQ
jgi:hypothetical protein